MFSKLTITFLRIGQQGICGIRMQVIPVCTAKVTEDIRESANYSTDHYFYVYYGEKNNHL